MRNETITLPLDVVQAWRKAVVGHEASDALRAHTRLATAVDAALWQPPVTEPAWILVTEHPHPVETKVLYETGDGHAGLGIFSRPEPRVIRWAWIEGISGASS